MTAGLHVGRRPSAVKAAHVQIPLVELGLIVALLIAYVSVPFGVNPEVLWGCLLLQYGLLIAALRRPLTLYGGLPTFISAEFLFLFFSYLIFFYPYQLHLFGLFDISRSERFPGKAFSEYSNHAVLLAAIGTLAFRAGLRCLRTPAIPPAASAGVGRRLDTVTVQALALPVFALQALLFVAYEFFGWRAEAEGRYTGTTAGGNFVEGVYTGITVLSMVAAALWVFPGAKDERRGQIFLWLSVVVASVWALRILLAGDRNGFMLIAIVAIGGFFTFRVRAGRWALAVMCTVALTMYNVIEQFRKGRIESLVDFLTSGGASTATSGDTSFNISTISVRAALANVPESFEYGYGLYKLVGFAGVVPFIRGAVIPPDMTFTQSSDVLVMILLGPSATWGVGTNVIADIYMDFGVLGVPALLFVTGFGVAHIQNGLIRHQASPWRAVLYLMTLALVAELPRYSFAFPVRPLVWVLLLFSAVSLLSIKSSNSAKVPTN